MERQDFRFADDILLFAMTRDEAAWILDAIVQALAAVGLLLNPTKDQAFNHRSTATVDVVNAKWFGRGFIQRRRFA